MMVKVAIIEENEQRLLELKTFLKAQPELACYFAGNTVADLGQIMRTNGSLQVVIIGVNEDGLNKLPPSYLRKIKAAYPETEFLLLADSADTKKVLTWIKVGVVGYLPRHTPPDQLKEAILGIRQGGAYIFPVMVRKMLDFFTWQEDFEGLLTERESEIVQCLVEGMSYKLMACKLNIALDTVRYHLRNIYKKLNVNSKAEVINKAVTRKVN